MIKSMAKIEIIGLLSELDRTLDFLQDVGKVQIDEIPTIEESDHIHIHRIHLDETKEYLLSRYEELSVTVNEVLDNIKEGDVEDTSLEINKRDEIIKLGPDELIKLISNIAKEVRRLARQRKNILQDLESAKEYETLINTFLPILEEAGTIGEKEQIGLILDHGESTIIPILKKRLEEITGPETTFFHQRMADNKVGVFLVVAPNDLVLVRKLLSNEGVTEYHIPKEFRKKNFQDSINTIRNTIKEIPEEIEKIDKQLLEIKKTNLALLRFIYVLCTNRLNQLKILSRLVRTRYTFMISGWTPTSEIEGLKKQLYEHFKDVVYVGRVKLNQIDFLHIPTLLSNRGILRSSEILLKLLPPPKYGNLDATPFIAIFFPIFFGIILGDMAYGLALLLIAGIIKWKTDKGSIISDVGSVAIVSAISTIFFGFLFGEFLGDFGQRFGIHAVSPWLHREEAIESLLVIAIGLGAIHIILGFLIKIYLNMVNGHIKGVIEGVAKVIVILSVITIFTQMFLGLSVVYLYSAFTFLGIGFIGVFVTEGFIGLLELFSIFGNILSYSRIMAIGIASVILAVVANRLAEASPNIVLAIFIGASIHLVNFAMGIFSPTIHSLRLHYVEFFSKFFEPSGKQFKPFKKIRENLS